MPELDRQIEAFSSQLSQIRADYGSGWIVFINEVQGAFPTFERAAEFAFDRFGDEDVLIRHTYQETEFVPFILVE